jgi:tetratricopeptide (TPR) repeat protein
MHIRGRRFWLVLVLLAVIGVASYRVGLHLWESYHYRAALAALDRRDFAGAGAHLDRCLELDGSDLATRLLAARTARRRNDYTTALTHLRAYEKGQGSPEAIALEHRLLQVQQGNTEQVADLLAFCRDQPDVPEVPLIREACIEGLLKAGSEPDAPQHIELARRAIERWIASRPLVADQAQGLVWRARAAAFANDQPASLADLRRALEIDPDHFEARLYLALFTADLSPADAAAHLRALHGRAPSDDRVRFALATVLRNLGELSEARQQLDDLLAAHPDHQMALAERGYVALELQDTADAEGWLRAALRLTPDDAQLNLALATCLRLANRAAEAQPYQERFEKLDRQRASRVSGARTVDKPAR